MPAPQLARHRDMPDLPPVPVDPEQARLPAAARDVLWLVTEAEGELVPPSNFGSMVAALGAAVADDTRRSESWHVVHRTGQESSCPSTAVAPRAYAAAARARRVQRALQRTHGGRWREAAFTIAGWLLEARRLPALGIAAGAAPLTFAAQVGWSRYQQATRVPNERCPQCLREWLVRLDARARAGRQVEVRLAREVAREAEEVLRAALAGLGRTR